MGPIRNPNWSTSGMRVTLSYLVSAVPAYEEVVRLMKVEFTEKVTGLKKNMIRRQYRY